MTDPVWRDASIAAAFSEMRAARVPHSRTQLEVLLRVMRGQLPPPRRVLDLGAGDGLLLAAVLEAFPASAGVAVDYSPEMLARARERLRPFASRASVVVADLGQPGWRDAVGGPFDAVVSGFAIHHLPDARKRALYSEIHAALAPGGLFLNLEHVASATPRVSALGDEAMIDHQLGVRREAGEDVSRETVRREYLARPDRAANILAGVDEQCAWLRALGYVDVDCFWKYFELALFGGVRPAAATPPCS